MKTLIIGGSKSGKSRFAEALSLRLASGGKLVYFATMLPYDSEDRERIARHVAQREGKGFVTVECGRDILSAPIPGEAPEETTVLMDSLTALFTNRMFARDYADEAASECAARAKAELSSDVSAYASRVKHLVCVADEVTRGGYDFPASTRAWMEGFAGLILRCAAEFDAVVEVTAGLARVRKGTLSGLDNIVF